VSGNVVRTDGWSDPASERLYREGWPGEPDCRERHARGDQCGGCAFFAPLNADWGLCAHPGSRHRLETVFEHFTCPAHVPEGWGPHSFSADPDDHCRCAGEPIAEPDPDAGT
jgi:hypothetical protein